MEGNKPDTRETQELTGKQYEKLADWGERAALGGLGSLVVQQIILGVPITRPSVIVGALVSAFAYTYCMSRRNFLGGKHLRVR